MGVLTPLLAAPPAAPALMDGPARMLENVNVLENAQNGPIPFGFRRLGNMALFVATTPATGYELWRTDGTEAGTALVKEIIPGPTEFFGRFIGEVNGALLFLGYDESFRQSLWRTDGTPEGTFLLTGPHSAFGTFLNAGISASFAGAYLFALDDGASGLELWRTDGTSAGTRLVKDINPGPSSSAPGNFMEFNGAVFFVADDGAHGQELWRTDGTESGTILVKDINPGPAGSHGFQLSQALGTIYFLADDGTHGFEPWRSDGSTAGTSLLKDINPGASTSDGLIGPGVVVDGILYFKANDGIHGRELWRTDGTEAGTALVKDIVPGGGASDLTRLTVFNDAVIFWVDQPPARFKLWRSDGTEEGTVLLRDFAVGASSSIGIAPFVEVNGSLVFATGGDSSTVGLWKTDGTAAGTVRFNEVSPELSRGLAPIDGALLFSTNDGVHPTELWRSDGTMEGTSLVQTFAPEEFDLGPGGFTVLGNRVLFVADDGLNGFTPWAGRAAILTGQPGKAVQDLKDEVESLQLAKGAETSLIAKLDAAGGALSGGRTTDAIHALQDFMKFLDAQSGKKIPEATTADLTEFAQDLVALLEGVFP
jgi:ELWxxDGT repeat protein